MFSGTDTAAWPLATHDEQFLGYLDIGPTGADQRENLGLTTALIRAATNRPAD
ncbi:hypothetical protein [Nocardia vinacea]|uniref:hypothetical protein n=1 Tax=Nocardia vinacea TaxID=96468 RepID=UPI0002F8EDC9|nr:hypothetical protein [Nocardia vinacea]